MGIVLYIMGTLWISWNRHIYIYIVYSTEDYIQQTMGHKTHHLSMSLSRHIIYAYIYIYIYVFQ